MSVSNKPLTPAACDLLITGSSTALTAQFHRLQNHCIYIQLFCNRLQSSLAINYVENSVALCNMSPDATVQPPQSPWA